MTACEEAKLECQIQMLMNAHQRLAMIRRRFAFVNWNLKPEQNRHSAKKGVNEKAWKGPFSWNRK